MRERLEAAGAAIAAATAVYATDAFGMWDANPGHWDVVTRFACALVMLLSGIACGAGRAAA